MASLVCEPLEREHPKLASKCIEKYDDHYLPAAAQGISEHVRSDLNELVELRIGGSLWMLIYVLTDKETMKYRLWKRIKIWHVPNLPKDLERKLELQLK